MTHKFFTSILTILLFIGGLQAYEYNLSVAAIFRDEAPYLREWIEYHKLQGVEHFYLYNNLSEDNYAEVLAPYVKSGEVTLIDWAYEHADLPDWDKLQISAYNRAIELAKKKTVWLAIIDIDEFLVPIKSSSIAEMLSPYRSDSKIGGICIPWVFFGTSHVSKIPENKLMIELLTLNAGPAAGGNINAIWGQGAFKSIVRPKYVKNAVSPHYCIYESKRSHIMLEFSEAQINHYWTRDEDYLHNYKIPRRVKWGQDPEVYLRCADNMNFQTPEGKPILRFVNALKKRMKIK